MTGQVNKSGGAAPFGYRRTENGFEPDPKEAPLRKLIFELFLKHKRKLTVANILNKKGYRTRSGAEFSDSSIDRFLRDPIVKGYHKDNYVPVHGKDKYMKLKQESEWRFAPIEPLIDEAIWNQINDLLYTQKKKPATKKPTSLFTGFLHCHCGGAMHHPYGRRSYFCPSCDNSIEVKIIESIFQEKLNVFPLNPDELKKAAARVSNADKEVDHVVILKKEKNDLESEMNKLYDLYISNSISKDRFRKKNAPLEHRIEAVEEELARLAKNTESKVQDYSALSSLREAWKVLTQSAKRQLIEIILDRITVDRTSINILFSLSPS